MLNRRHIRIKVMQSLYACVLSKEKTIESKEKFLVSSLNNLYNLYLISLALLKELYHKSVEYNEKLSQKLSKNSNQQHGKLENNKLLQLLAADEQLLKVIDKEKLNVWHLDFEYVDILFKDIIGSKLHSKFREKSVNFSDHKYFLLDVYAQIIAPNEKLYDYFEDKNLTWADDFPLVNTLILKMLRKINENTSGKHHFLTNLYKDPEDRLYAFQLYQYTIENDTQFTEIIAAKTKNWDSERIAIIDGILLKMALSEFQFFPTIPHKVTINEYLEIAKDYSTPKSSIFINGILDKIVKEYSAANSYPKTGRGLL